MASAKLLNELESVQRALHHKSVGQLLDESVEIFGEPSYPYVVGVLEAKINIAHKQLDELITEVAS